MSRKNDISDESNFNGSASRTEDRPVVKIEEEVEDGVGSTDVHAESREVEEACRREEEGEQVERDRAGVRGRGTVGRSAAAL